MAGKFGEPWRVGFSDGSGKGTITTLSENSDGLPKAIARMHWGCSCCDSGEEYMTQEQREWETRIVACVNALAGVEDPAAFMAAVRGAIAANNAERLDMLPPHIDAIKRRMTRSDDQ